MKIIDSLRPESIYVSDEIMSKNDLLDFLAGEFALSGGYRNELLQSFFKREELASTAIGNGIAIPHAICRCFPGSLVKICINRKGIDFGAVDGKPVFLIIAIAANTDNQKAYLSLLSDAAKIFSDDRTLKRILSEESAKKIYGIVKEISKV